MREGGGREEGSVREGGGKCEGGSMREGGGKCEGGRRELRRGV